MNLKAPSTTLRLVALAGLTGLAAALTFGYLGRFHPALDAFSHFRVHLAVLFCVAAPLLLLLRLRVEAVFAAALAVMTLAQTVWTVNAPALAADGNMEGPVYRLLQLNVYHLNANREAVLSLIGEVRPDVVTLNEVSERWLEKLALIETAYPYQMVCPKPDDAGGVAILSRRPYAAGFHPYCAADGAMAHMQFDFGGRRAEVVALHVGWPWPYHQQKQVPDVAGLLRHVGDTAIIAGDLNAAPWSHSARVLEAAADARLLRGIGPTWLFRQLPVSLRPLIGLPIDNVMVKGGVVPVGLGTVAGGASDHAPVLFEFTLLPEEEPAETLQAVVVGE